MTNYWNHYHTPSSIDDAVALLNTYNGDAQVVGGGTDLLLEIQQGSKPRVEALIDPTKISELGNIEEEGEYLVIGCGVTHTRIVKDPRIIQHGTCLVESCGVIGGPQVRNVGTLAGNVAHALPAGDGTIGLLALGGEVEIADADGLRWVPMAETFVGPGQSIIDHHRALLTRLRFIPTGEKQGSAFRRVMRPQGVALPMINMASRIHLDEAGLIQAARISIGPAGPTPFLAEQAMEGMVGKTPTADTFSEAADAARAQASLRSSKHRATQEYRAEMIRVQLPKTLALATHRAATGQAVPEGVGK